MNVYQKYRCADHPRSAFLFLLKNLRIFIFLTIIAFYVQSGESADLPLDRVKLPPGFKIEIFAEGIDNARQLAISSEGTVFIGTRKAGGKVYAVKGKDGSLKGKKEIMTILNGYRSPNGVAYKDGSLFFAEVSRIWEIENIEQKIQSGKKLKPVLIFKDLPNDAWHGWKYIRFGPDNKLYFSVGAPCNVCERDDLRYASMLRLETSTGDLKIFARGVRNSVGFDWHPLTGDLWFTDNGRDMMGDDIPPDELNHAPNGGLHFGFPYCHGGDIPDPQFGKKNACQNFAPPAQELDAHVASLGIKFYTGDMFPEEYRNQIFIAEHGSWNRSKKSGYRIMSVTLDGNTVKDYKVFAEGWMEDEKVWGRPVDLLNLPDGSLLVSDDHAGVVYRITYQKQ